VEDILGDSVISSISVGIFPQALIFNPSNNNIYVARQVTAKDHVSSKESIWNELWN
jgi:DNA-binding beta-propeller fold protein YncE